MEDQLSSVALTPDPSYLNWVLYETGMYAMDRIDPCAHGIILPCRAPEIHKPCFPQISDTETAGTQVSVSICLSKSLTVECSKGIGYRYMWTASHHCGLFFRRTGTGADTFQLLYTSIDTCSHYGRHSSCFLDRSP